jgi:hypothetical protein
MRAKAKRKGSAVLLDVPRFEQPNDVTCGPTCLAQVYRYYGSKKPLATVIEETRQNPDGGTLAVYLGLRALRDGFATQIYTYNLRVFDPTWYELDVAALKDKLRDRLEISKSERRRRSISAYIEYLDLGGKLRFPELTPRLLARILNRKRPVITGLNATYLYGTPREFNNEYDDIRGEPTGHFVVVSGYYPRSDRFIVRDPSTHIPFSRTGRYSVKAQKLISAILLGDVTYDAVLLVISPR